MNKIILISIIMVGSLVAETNELADGFEALNESIVVEEKYDLNVISTSSIVDTVKEKTNLEEGEEVAGENDKNFEVTDEYIRKAIAELDN